MVIGVNQFPGLQQNIPQRFALGQQQARTLEQQRLANVATQTQQAEAQRLQGLTATALGGQQQRTTPPAQLTADQAATQAFIQNPEAGKQIFERLGVVGQERKDNLTRIALQASGFQGQARNDFLNTEAGKLEDRGVDASNLRDLATLPQQQQEPFLKSIGIAGLPPEKQRDILAGRLKLKTPAGVTNIVPAAGGGFIGIQPTPTGVVESVFIPPPAGKKTQKQVDEERKTQEDRVKDDVKASDTQFDRAKKLRGEITKASTEFKKIESAFGRIEASSAAPSAAGDLALIFNFMKMLDPGSVVREGEFATAQNAAGVPDRVVNTYNRLLSGERLAPKQRDDFVGQAKRIFDRSITDNNKAVEKIIDIGEQFDVPREQLVSRIEEGIPDKGATELTDDEIRQSLGL